MTHKGYAMGVDIGGSHITTGIIDLDSRKFIDGSERRTHVNENGTATAIIKAWADTIQDTLQSFDNPCEHIGIAMPGPFDYDNGISLMKDDHKFGALYQLNVRHALATALGMDAEQIRFRNDAEAFLEGEVFCGAGANFNKVIGITLGTGLGSARWTNGKCEDANLWNTPFHTGIAEDYLSTRWFIKRYQELTGEQVNDVKQLVLQFEENKNVQHLFHEFSINLATFLTKFIQTERPEAIILGGNISRSFSLFKNDLLNQLPKDYCCEVKAFELGEHAALVGAACLW